MDFNSEIQHIERLLKKDEAPSAATRSVLIIEQALRYIALQYQAQVDDEVKRKLQAGIQKRGQKTIAKLTMGQLVYAFQESGFLEACFRVIGEEAYSFSTIKLPELIQLRNNIIHNAQDVRSADAELLFHYLEFILKAFKISKMTAKEVESEIAPILFRDGHALIIGVGADLPNTVDDATGLADIFKDSGRCAYPHEQVTVLTGPDATRTKILNELDMLAQRTDPESTVVVYFSGHGYQVSAPTGNAYYLIPYGYNVQALHTTAITGTEFAEKLKAIPAQKLLLLLDCCHAGGIGDIKAPVNMVKKSIPPEIIPLLSEGQGRVLIASSKDDEVSYAGKPYSVFTLALLEALCGTDVARKDGCVRVADVTRYTGKIVSRRTDDRQNPVWDFSRADNFILAYYAGGEMQPKDLPFESSEIHPPNNRENNHESGSESLDTRILQILYAYYQDHRGEPEMNIDVLLYQKLPEYQIGVVFDEILKLKEYDWIDSDVTTKATKGLVWLTKKGRQVAKSERSYSE